MFSSRWAMINRGILSPIYSQKIMCVSHHLAQQHEVPHRVHKYDHLCVLWLQNGGWHSHHVMEAKGEERINMGTNGKSSYSCVPFLCASFMRYRDFLQGKKTKSKSFEPDSNQRPMDFNEFSSPSTVHRSTNWAIEGPLVYLTGSSRFYSPRRLEDIALSPVVTSLSSSQRISLNTHHLRVCIERRL